MSRFDSPLSYAILFLGIIIASTVLILLVTVDAKHRKETKDSRQLEVADENIFSTVGRRWTEFWYGKPRNDTSNAADATDETNEIPRRKRSIDLDVDSSAHYSVGSDVPMKTARHNLISKTNKVVNEQLKSGPKQRKLLWSQFFDDGYETDIDSDNTMDDEQYMEAPSKRKRGNAHALRSEPKELTVERHGHNPASELRLRHSRRSSGIQKDLYLFTNNSLYFVGNHRTARDSKKRRVQKSVREIKICFTIVELIVAATASVALTITVILFPVLGWFYCHSSKKARHVEETFRPDSWWVSDNIEDSSNTNRSSLLAGQDGALLYTKSYVQPNCNGKTQTSVINSTPVTKTPNKSSPARQSTSPPCIEVTTEEKKMSTPHSAKKSTPKSDDTSRKMPKPRMSAEQLLSFDS